MAYCLILCGPPSGSPPTGIAARQRKGQSAGLLCCKPRQRYPVLRSGHLPEPACVQADPEVPSQANSSSGDPEQQRNGCCCLPECRIQQDMHIHCMTPTTGRTTRTDHHLELLAEDILLLRSKCPEKATCVFRPGSMLCCWHGRGNRPALLHRQPAADGLTWSFTWKLVSQTCFFSSANPASRENGATTLYLASSRAFHYDRPAGPRPC